MNSEGKRLVISLRQLKRSVDIVKKCIDNKYIGFAINKAIYVGMRIAFYLDMNVKSRKIFDDFFT